MTMYCYDQISTYLELGISSYQLSVKMALISIWKLWVPQVFEAAVWAGYIDFSCLFSGKLKTFQIQSSFMFYFPKKVKD